MRLIDADEILRDTAPYEEIADVLNAVRQAPTIIPTYNSLLELEPAAKLFELVKQYGVDHLCELVEAEKGGRLVVLPAKTVFELTWDVGENCDFICPASVDGKGCCELCEKGKLFVYERPCCQDHIPQIGNTVFLTREEAEAALEARRREADNT